MFPYILGYFFLFIIEKDHILKGKSIIDVNPVMACFYKEYYDLANLLLTKGASPYVVEVFKEKKS